MSGGKETPRQKMIGMMYLVLTALLALNVSNAVLEKFAIIDDTLSKAVNDDNGAGGTNEGKLAAILNSKVEDKTGAKDKAQKVRDLTKATIDLFNTRHFAGNRRGLGFDKPSLSPGSGSTCRQASASSFGHTGFTGTMCWAAPSTAPSLSSHAAAGRQRPGAESVRRWFRGWAG